MSRLFRFAGPIASQTSYQGVPGRFVMFDSCTRIRLIRALRSALDIESVTESLPFPAESLKHYASDLAGE
ncbi:MAG: hypothetical protein C0511_14990 [Hyphomicrobium sp.]|nr:hypothetical protein [Hyphomicrobium sp.]